MAHLGGRKGRLLDHVRGGSTRQDRRVDRQARPDAQRAFADTVVGRPDQVELTELGERLHHPVVAVGFLDPGHQGQQEFLGYRLVAGEGEVARPFQLPGDRHRCIISRGGREEWKSEVAKAADVRGTSAASPGATYQLQVTLISNFFVIIPAIGFFMSAPCASPVMV